MIKLRSTLPAFLALTCLGAFAQSEAPADPATAGAEGDAVTEEGQAGNTNPAAPAPAQAANEALLEGETPQQQEEANERAAQEQAAASQPATPTEIQHSTSLFANADQDGNGLLGVEEANTAFPDLTFEDRNGDGLLNQVEADAAVDGLNLTVAGAGQHSVIGEYGFLQIVRMTSDVPGMALEPQAPAEGEEAPAANETAQANDVASADEDV